MSERRTKDGQEIREMLRAMQAGELTVSRGVELVDMWLAGNYRDDLLPPVREGLGEDEMPCDRIDALAAQRDLQLDALIMAVERPFQGETRFETALRYIRDAEEEVLRRIEDVKDPPKRGGLAEAVKLARGGDAPIPFKRW